MGFGAAECDGPAERCVLLVRVIVVEAQQGGRVGFCLAGEVRAHDLRVVGGDAAELVRAGRELHPGAVLRGDGLRGAQHLVCFMRVGICGSGGSVSSSSNRQTFGHLHPVYRLYAERSG